MLTASEQLDLPGGTPAIQLHLGCGERWLPGFIHVDIRPLEHVDVVTSVADLRMFEDNSVDLLYHCAVLEHISRWKSLDVLREWHRVLKPGGVMMSSVPNFEAYVEAYQKFGDVKLLLGLLYGRQDYTENTHYTVFDRKYYSELCEQAGFTEPVDYDWRDFLPNGYDDFSRAYLPHMAFDTGIQMMLNVRCEKRRG